MYSWRIAMKAKVDARRIAGVISAILTDRYDRRIRARLDADEKGSKDTQRDSVGTVYDGRGGA